MQGPFYWDHWTNYLVGKEETPEAEAWIYTQKKTCKWVPYGRYIKNTLFEVKLSRHWHKPPMKINADQPEKVSLLGGMEVVCNHNPVLKRNSHLTNRRHPMSIITRLQCVTSQTLYNPTNTDQRKQMPTG